MNCLWEDVPGSHDGNGKRRVRCMRRGCWMHERQSGLLAEPHEKINSECEGVPFAHEWREWLRVFADSYGLTQANAIVQYIRWRANGSKLDHLPPGVPRPTIRPQSPSLTDSEVAELFPGEDPTLLGNRIKALTDHMGIPACGGCESRRQWLNKAHEWLRSS